MALNRPRGHCPSVTRDARCQLSKRANSLPGFLLQINAVADIVLQDTAITSSTPVLRRILASIRPTNGPV